MASPPWWRALNPAIHLIPSCPGWWSSRMRTQARGQVLGATLVVLLWAGQPRILLIALPWVVGLAAIAHGVNAFLS